MFLKILKLISSRSLLTLIGIISLSVAVPTFADTSATTVGRYLSVQNQALTAQTDLLQQTFQIRFPSHIKTISDAMRYTLRFSGYSLVDYKNLPSEAQAMIVLPLPQVDRTLGPVNLQGGLLTLAGDSFGLLVDPVHRLISFRLKPTLQTIYQKSAV